MEKHHEKLEKALAKIRKVLSKRPEVLAAYLYGSRAKGYAREGSDLDVGVLLYPGKDYSLWEQGALWNDLEGIEGFDVQTFVINDKPPLFRYQVISPRQVIFCRDDSLRADFEVHTFNEYFEAKPFLEEGYQAALETARGNLDARRK